MSPGELPHLETFCKAAELVNFTAAAEALALTQAAVSQRIKALEDNVGTPLFERHAGKVTLTPAGQKLYDFAKRILALHQAARGALGQVAVGELTGELRLAASTVPAEHLLPDILAAFQKRFPKVAVVATVADSAAVLQSLEAGTVHLALVGKPGPADWTESRAFARDRLALVVPPAHPWAQRAKIKLDELRGQPIVLRESGSGSRVCFEEGLRRAGKRIEDFTIALQMGSNEAIKEAVLRGAGAALLSGFAIRNDVASGRLVAVPVAGLDVVRDLYLVTDKRRGLAAEARAFREVLEALPFAIAG